MKRSVVLLTFLLNLCGVVFGHSYYVYGEDDYGRTLEGTIYSSGSRSVYGELSDAYGNTFDFDGRWDGYGHISGGTDDGASIELNIN